MTYTERLNILAEKMARKYWDTSDLFMFDEFSEDAKKVMINQFIPLAEIALQEMAEVAKDAYDKGWIDSPKYEIRYNTGIHNYITKTGLFPDKK